MRSPQRFVVPVCHSWMCPVDGKGRREDDEIGKYTATTEEPVCVCVCLCVCVYLCHGAIHRLHRQSIDE
jgi:hypothetical protein